MVGGSSFSITLPSPIWWDPSQDNVLQFKRCVDVAIRSLAEECGRSQEWRVRTSAQPSDTEKYIWRGWFGLLGQLVEPTYGTVATMATVTIVGDSGHGDHNVHGCDLMARVAIAGDSGHGDDGGRQRPHWPRWPLSRLRATVATMAMDDCG